MNILCSILALFKGEGKWYLGLFYSSHMKYVMCCICPLKSKQPDKKSGCFDFVDYGDEIWNQVVKEIEYLAWALGDLKIDK
jgi:hypothetical protein